MEALSQRFHLGPRAAESKSALLEELERVLRERRDRGRDYGARDRRGAESERASCSRKIRLLANVETATEKLLPLVLSGQPELRERLNLNELRQLKQRVTLRCEIGAVQPPGDRGLHRHAHQDCRRRRRTALHARRGHAHSRALAWHPAHGQRDVRQRARQRFRDGPPARRQGDRCRSCARLRSCARTRTCPSRPLPRWSRQPDAKTLPSAAARRSLTRPRPRALTSATRCSAQPTTAGGSHCSGHVERTVLADIEMRRR